MIVREQICSKFLNSALFCVLALSTAAQAQPVADTTGKEWRQLTETMNLSWQDVSAVCPTDGQTPCSGTAADVDLTDWVWANAGLRFF